MLKLFQFSRHDHHSARNDGPVSSWLNNDLHVFLLCTIDDSIDTVQRLQKLVENDTLYRIPSSRKTNV
jgi:hypothetical protein